MMDNCPEFPTVARARQVGIVTALPIPQRSVLRTLEQTAARARFWPVRSRGGLSDELPPLLPRGPLEGCDWRTLADIATDDEPRNPRSHRAAVRLGDPLYYIFTSGTTGLPKAALMSHLRFLNAGGVIAGLLDLTRADVLYNVLPLYHGAGGMVIISAALHVGIPIVLRRRFSATEFWDDVRRHRVTAWYYIGEICRYLW